MLSNFYFLIWFYISPNELLRKKRFDLDKMQYFLEVLKPFKFTVILVHHSHQSSLGLEWVVTWLVTWLQAWLVCFSSVNLTFIVHTKCWKGALCMEAKFRGKTSQISQAWSRKLRNLRHNSEHVDLVVSSTGRRQENWIFRLLNIHKNSLYSGW